MTFTDQGTRVVMKIFTARVRSTRAVKIHYNPSAEVSKSHDMPDYEAGKVIISNITEILVLKKNMSLRVRSKILS